MGAYDCVRERFNWEVQRVDGASGEGTTIAKLDTYEDAVVVANRYGNTRIYERTSGVYLHRHEKTVIEYV